MTRFAVPLRPLALMVVGVAAIIVMAVGLRPASSPVGSARPSGSPAVSASATPATGVEEVPGAWSHLSWSSSSSGLSTMWDATLWDGALVALGRTSTGQTATTRSTDGTTWTDPDTASSAAFGSDANALQFVQTRSRLLVWGSDGEPACTGQGEGASCGPVPQAIWASEDGLTWTRISDSSAFSGFTIRALVEGPAGPIAVGADQADTAQIWASSNDGSSWRRLSLPSSQFGSAHLWTIASTSAEGYLIGGSLGPESTRPGGVLPPARTTPALWTSADGQTWTKIGLQDGVSVESIQAGPSGFVAIGSLNGGKEAIAWVSADGQSWRRVAIGGSGLPFPSVLGDGRHLIAPRYSLPDADVWTSLDGLTWTDLGQSGGAPAFSEEQLQDTVLLPGGVLIFGQPAGDGTAVDAWYGAAQP